MITLKGLATFGKGRVVYADVVQDAGYHRFVQLCHQLHTHFKAHGVIPMNVSLDPTPHATLLNIRSKRSWKKEERFPISAQEPFQGKR